MKNKKGFTLIELMGVIVLMGIIALIAVPVYNNTTKKVRQKEYENVVTAIEVASEKYAEKTAKIKFSVQELVDRGEYEADNEKGEVLSPIDKKVLNCHIINVNYENENYHATFTEENDCDIANGLKDTFGVSLEATDEEGNKVISWTKSNVTLKATINEAGLPGEVKGKDYTATYDWFSGNVKVNNESKDTYQVTAQTILNSIYQVRVTIHTKDNNKDYNAMASIKVQIDKQNPLISKVNADNSDKWVSSSVGKNVTIIADDYNGSGIKGYYIGTGTICPESGYDENSNLKATEKGNYIACVMDNVGNITKSDTFKIENIDAPLPTVKFEASDNILSGKRHIKNFILSLETDANNYHGSPIIYKYGTDKEKIEMIGGSISITPETSNQTYYGLICNDTECSKPVEYEVLFEEMPPIPNINITGKSKVLDGKIWYSDANIDILSDNTNYHGSKLTYYYKMQSTDSATRGNNFSLSVPETAAPKSYTIHAQACNESNLCTNFDDSTSELNLAYIPDPPTIKASDGVYSGNTHIYDFALYVNSSYYNSLHKGITYYYGTTPNTTTNEVTKIDLDKIYGNGETVTVPDDKADLFGMSDVLSNKITATPLARIDDDPIPEYPVTEGGIKQGELGVVFVLADAPEMATYYFKACTNYGFCSDPKKAYYNYTSDYPQYSNIQVEYDSDWTNQDLPITFTATARQSFKAWAITKSPAKPTSWNQITGEIVKNQVNTSNGIRDSHTLTQKASIPSNGVYYIWVKTTDGNSKYETVQIWNIDKEPPEVVEVDGGYSTDDALSGVASRAHAFGTSTVTPPKRWINWSTRILLGCGTTYYHWVKSIDNAGNELITAFPGSRYYSCPSTGEYDEIDPCTPRDSAGICGYKSDLCEMYANSILWYKYKNQGNSSKQDACYQASQPIGNFRGLTFNSGNGTWNQGGLGEIYSWCGLKPASYWAGRNDVDLSAASSSCR